MKTSSVKESLVAKDPQCQSGANLALELSSLDQLWGAIYELTAAHNAMPLHKHQGLWTVQLDQQWKLAANGHVEAIEGIPPFSVAVEYNGWPAGIVDPYGCTVAHGELANIETLTQAIKQATERKLREVAGATEPAIQSQETPRATADNGYTGTKGI